MFRNNEVRNAVLKVVDDRIDEAQKDFNTGVKEINDDTSEAMNTLILASKARKELLLETCVAEVLR